jgi:hypothetical protein
VQQRREWRIATDLQAVSGGHNPAAQLFRQSGGPLAWDEEIAAFRPGAAVQACRSAGAADGRFGLAAALLSGHESGIAAASGAGFPSAGIPPRCPPAGPATPVLPIWQVPGRGKAFVDFQNDVTVGDIEYGWIPAICRS